MTFARRGYAGAGPAGLAQAPKLLKFIPQADLAVVDPVITTAYVTRHHAYMIYDTLYGFDEEYKAQPQMVEGHTVEDGGKRVTMKLRAGLRFHDNTPVLAKDAVASVKRWAARDALGQVMNSVLEELTAPDDQTIVFRFRRPFPMLFEALASPPRRCAS